MRDLACAGVVCTAMVCAVVLQARHELTEDFGIYLFAAALGVCLLLRGDL